ARARRPQPAARLPLALPRRIQDGVPRGAGVLVVTNLILSARSHSFLLDRIDGQLLSASSSLERRLPAATAAASRGRLGVTTLSASTSSPSAAPPPAPSPA
ncbi:MAG: hypothetical protein KY439_12460, partial [Actinobacteria bacterium]|nr:hypothetical protein [Actinomycetota bacterium]